MLKMRKKDGIEMTDKPPDLYDDIVASNKSFKKGMVKCDKCGKTEKVDSAECLRNGWKECCGYTMRLLT